MNNKIGYYCKDIIVGYLVYVVLLSFKILIVIGMVWGIFCILCLNIVNYS